ncbi:hypothetical protein CspeluHIS016_0600890 [Cutaneotrichosporon spelunceum]|uniref:ferric-chelate reductase (NADPH) n=1 Tax=Cutaneotrichosporon spelunceum TaxID=1672016 RepID=A0AAD3TYC2_9TREE|nr:hypothetical protein CspeluHIS016_0600890 [Cutaneotrichosporon spelunceum]
MGRADPVTHIARAGTQGQGGGNAEAAKANKLLRKAHRAMGTNIYWWTIAGLVATLGLLRLFGLVRAWRIRQRAAVRLAETRSSTTSTTLPPSAEKDLPFAAASAPAAEPAQPSLSTAARAARALFNNYAYVRVFPLWIFSHTNAAELWWTAAYTGVVLGIAFWLSYWDGVLDIANPMGYAAFMQLPLIVGLASKNNVLSAITGISYEKLNYLHRASGRVCVLTTYLHWGKWVQKGLGRHGPGSEIFLTGVLGCVALSLMFLSSFALVRRVAYEFFLLVHILMGIVFLVAVYFHSPARWFQYWVWPSLFLWGLDRFVSFGRMVVVNKVWLLPFRSRREEHSACTVELVSPEVMRLRVRRPLFRWRAGQHAFITMPGVARLRYEQHPFTMANVPDDSGEAVFLVRAQTGFTRRLVDRLASTKDEINCYLDGPYGTPADLNHYGGVLLVAGGTGVTYGLAHLAAIVRASRNGNSACSSLRLAWNVRTEDAAEWIAPMLNTALAEGTESVHVCVDIFVTSSHLADEPNAIECPELHHPHPGNEDTPAETPDSSPDDTPVHSPDGSPKELSPRSSVDAAEKGSGNVDMAKALRYGFTGLAASVVRFHRGRSNVEMLLRTDMDGVAPHTAGVAVGVCGPSTLMLDARRAVCSVNSARAVLKGQAPIDLYSETFGW